MLMNNTFIFLFSLFFHFLKQNNIFCHYFYHFSLYPLEIQQILNISQADNNEIYFQK